MKHAVKRNAVGNGGGFSGPEIDGLFPVLERHFDVGVQVLRRNPLAGDRDDQAERISNACSNAAISERARKFWLQV